MTVRFERGFTLQDALNILDNEDDEDGREIQGIFIAPPESSVQTDEDSGDEEGGLVENLSGKQLLANAQITYTYNENDTHDDADQTDLDSGNLSEGVQTPQNLPVGLQNCADDNFNAKKENIIREIKLDYVKEQQQRKKKNTNNRKKTWIKSDMEDRNATFPDPDFSKYQDFSASELFELFFDDVLFDIIEQETRNYALFKNCPNPNITKENIKCFLAILVFSGYSVLLGKRFYWDSQPDLRKVSYQTL